MQRIWDHRGTRQSGTSARSHRRTAQARPYELLETRRLFAIPAGPDGFYYEAKAHAYEAIDLELSNGGTSILDHGDDDAVALPLGSNTFNFYGQTYNSLLVSTNGFITFGSTVEEYNLFLKDASAFPDSLTSNIDKPMIAPHWADLRSDTNAFDQIFYRFDDQGGDGTPDRLIVEWSNVRRTSAPSSSTEAAMTFQAILQLNSGPKQGAITFNYVDIATEDPFATNGRRATVGIKGDGVQSPNNAQAHRLLVSGPSNSSLGGSLTAVQITSNRPPVVEPIASSVNEGGTAPLTVTATDPDGDALTYAWDFDGDGEFDDATGPNPLFSAAGRDGPATVSLSVRVSDGVWSTTASGAVTVENVAPSAAADSAEGDEDGVIQGNVLANDSDPADPITASLVEGAGPAHGTLLLNADGTFAYTPKANFHGTDSFTYAVTDDDGETSTAVVTLTVAPVNDAPVALNNTYTTDEDVALVVAAPGVLGNDDDVDGDTLAATALTQPAHGVLALKPDGSFTYTPHANYYGPDSFTYTVSDGHGGTATATVTINVASVNDAPVAGDDAFATNEDTTVSGNVLGNDTDVDGPAAGDAGAPSLTAVIVSQPRHGTVTLSADGSFSYVPNGNFHGTDSFTYEAVDAEGAPSSPATVTVTVASVNDAPVANGETHDVVEDTPLTVAAGGLLANDTDADGDSLAATVVAGPAHGVLALAADGTFTYTPDANYHGTDSFTYSVSDGRGGTATASVTLTVASVNDAPVAGDDAFVTNEDTPLVVPAPGVLANDTDADRDSLGATLLSGPAHGTLALAGDGSFRYTPHADYHGSDSFSYRADDGHGGSAVATVSITVNAVNDGPTAKADAYALVEDTPLSVTVGGLLANDTDADGDALTVQLVTGPERGVLTLRADGTFDYVPGGNFAGEVTFTYTVSDGQATSAPVTVTLNIAEVNDAPVAGNDRGSTTDLEPISGNVLVNDSDVDDVALTAALAPGAPLAGTLAFNSNGSFTYTPVPGFSGTETFSYVVSDGRGGSSVGTVEIVVTAEQEPEATIQLLADPTLPGRTMLVVNGTDASEVLAAVHHPNGVEVYFGFESRGVYQPTGRIVIRGNGGNDVLLIGPAVHLPAWLYGDAGNDVLKLGHGGGIAFGGDGNDVVSGGNGRDLLVGGEGADLVLGLAGDDVLIAGYTTYDGRSNPVHEQAWSHLHAEWVSTRSFEQRVASLRGGGGLNGSYFLNNSTVGDDATPTGDILTGSGGTDWFVYKFGEDKVTALTGTEASYDLGIA